MKKQLQVLTMVGILVGLQFPLLRAQKEVLEQVQRALGFTQEKPSLLGPQESAQESLSDREKARRRVRFWQKVLRGFKCLGEAEGSRDTRKAVKYLNRAQNDAAGLPRVPSAPKKTPRFPLPSPVKSTPKKKSTKGHRATKSKTAIKQASEKRKRAKKA